MGDFVVDDVLLYIGIGALGLIVAFGIVGAALARKRGRGPVTWGLLCVFCGPLGLIVLVCLPKVRSHPVWRSVDAAGNRASLTAVSEKDTTTRRLPSRNGELRGGVTPFASEPADQTVDAGETSLPEAEAAVPEVAPPQAPRSLFEVGLLEPPTTDPDVAPAQALRDTIEPSLLEPPRTAADVAPPQSPRSATTTPAPRRARLPGGPTGYPDFQALSRGEKRIELQCPNCGYVFRRPNSLLGKLEKCPECRAVMRIPT